MKLLREENFGSTLDLSQSAMSSCHIKHMIDPSDCPFGLIWSTELFILHTVNVSSGTDHQIWINNLLSRNIYSKEWLNT